MRKKERKKERRKKERKKGEKLRKENSRNTKTETDGKVRKSLTFTMLKIFNGCMHLYIRTKPLINFKEMF
jgi:hypothetical protein